MSEEIEDHSAELGPDWARCVTGTDALGALFGGTVIHVAFYKDADTGLPVIVNWLRRPRDDTGLGPGAVVLPVGEGWMSPDQIRQLRLAFEPHERIARHLVSAAEFHRDELWRRIAPYIREEGSRGP